MLQELYHFSLSLPQDYEHMDELRFRQQLEARSRREREQRGKSEKRSGKFDHKSKFHMVSQQSSHMFADDPYYCGLRARIPNFAKSKAQREKEANALYARLPAENRPNAMRNLAKTFMGG